MLGYMGSVGLSCGHFKHSPLVISQVRVKTRTLHLAICPNMYRICMLAFSSQPVWLKFVSSNIQFQVKQVCSLVLPLLELIADDSASRSASPINATMSLHFVYNPGSVETDEAKDLAWSKIKACLHWTRNSAICVYSR